MHKHSVGVPVILRDTGERGTVLTQLPDAGPKPRYRIVVTGRPAIPGRPAGQGRSRNVDEDIIDLGVTPSELVVADKLMREAMRAMPPLDRVDLRTDKTATRDSEASTDHDISEALRYIEAITLVEAE